MNEIPTRRNLRALVFWASRWLLGGSEYYQGPLKVVVAIDDEVGSEHRILRPKRDDELYDATNSPLEAERLTEMAPRLLVTFMSPDSLALMKLVARRGPVPAKVIAGASEVERTRCYELLRDLRERGLIRDQGDGYELAAPEVWQVFSLWNVAAQRANDQGEEAVRKVAA